MKLLVSHSRIQVCTAVLMMALLDTTWATAQTKRESLQGYRNVVRLDLGGPLVLNLLNADSKGAHRLLMPLLLGYERRVGKRTSANAELILNGGFAHEKTTGVTLQGRYYPFLSQGRAPLGVHIAPVLSYRAIRETINYNNQDLHVRSRLGGAGVLVGIQVPLGFRFVFDAAGGYVAWRRLWDDSRVNVEASTYREIDPAVFDGRLGIGYRF